MAANDASPPAMTDTAVSPSTHRRRPRSVAVGCTDVRRAVSGRDHRSADESAPCAVVEGLREVGSSLAAIQTAFGSVASRPARRAIRGHGLNSRRDHGHRTGGDPSVHTSPNSGDCC